MFFHVAGDGPFGEFDGIVLVGVLHHGVEDVQGHGGFLRCVFQAAGRAGLRAHRRALGGNGGLKVGDVCAEVREEIGVEAEADELRGERRRVGLKSAGGVEQGLIAAAAGQEKFSVQSRRAEQHEGMRGVADAQQVVVEMEAGGDFGEHAAVRGVRAGDLRRAERGGLGDGGVDEGELLTAEAGGRKVGGVGDAEGVHGFEGGGEGGDLLVHDFRGFLGWLCGEYPPIAGGGNDYFRRLATGILLSTP